jgi:hypothetical protein
MNKTNTFQYCFDKLIYVLINGLNINPKCQPNENDLWNYIFLIWQTIIFALINQIKCSKMLYTQGDGVVSLERGLELLK